MSKITSLVLFSKNPKTRRKKQFKCVCGGNERKKRENNRSAAGVLNHRCSLKGIMVKKNSGVEQKPKNGIKKPSPGTQNRFEIVMKLLILLAKEI